MPDQVNQMMGKKAGGKWTIGQYFSYQKQYFMWLVIAAVAVGALSLIPGLYAIMGFISWIVFLFAAFVYFWFGYQMAKEKKGELKDALIGGAVIGVTVGLVMAIFRAIATFIFYNTITAGFGALGIGIGTSVAGIAIGGFFVSLISAAIGGLVLSLIGFAVAGGFNKGSAQ